MNRFMAVTGVMITSISAFFVAASGTDLMSGSPEDADTLILVLGFFSLTGIFGLYLTVTNTLRYRKKARAVKQRIVLRLAAAKRGRLTPVEVAAETRLILDEARKTLDQLCKVGRGESKTTPRGQLFYEFREFLPSGEEPRDTTPKRSRGIDKSPGQSEPETPNPERPQSGTPEPGTNEHESPEPEPEPEPDTLPGD